MPDLYCQFGAGSPDPFATLLPVARVNDTGVRTGSPAKLKKICADDTVVIYRSNQSCVRQRNLEETGADVIELGGKT